MKLIDSSVEIMIEIFHKNYDFSLKHSQEMNLFLDIFNLTASYFKGRKLTSIY
jgi:hypothetical protein